MIINLNYLQILIGKILFDLFNNVKVGVVVDRSYIILIIIIYVCEDVVLF